MMSRIAQWCAHNPLRVAVLALASLALGALAWRNIPLEYLYDPSPPQLLVVVAYPGAVADLVSANVTARLEHELRAIPGVRRIVSRSVDGSGAITIDFDRKMRFDAGERQVRERVGRLRYQLPREIRDPEIFQIGGGNDQAVLELAVGSERRVRAELTEWVTNVVRPRVEAVAGVGDVSISGDAPRQLDIEFEPTAAAALGVALQDVATAIQRENVDVRTGYVQSPSRQRTLRVNGRFDSPASFEQIVVRREGPMVVRLGAVARVRDSAAEPVAQMRFNGRDSLSIKVFPLPHAHVADVSARLVAAMGELRAVAPDGVFVESVVDNSDYARASLDSVQRAMLEGAVLTVLLVAFCLRSATSSFITALTLPLSVLITVTGLWALGYSLNLFTLLALTLSIGVLIDDAIVVRENIVRHRAMGLSARDSAIRGTVQIGRAVASTTLVIVAVFLPLLLAGGPLGRFITQFGVTVALAVTVSWVVSFTVDPALSVLLGGRLRVAAARPPSRWRARITKAGKSMLDIVLRFRIAVALGAAGLLLLGAHVWRQLPTELMPEFDEGLATLNVQLPVGSTPAYLRAKAIQVEQAVREQPEVVDVLTGIGTPRSKNVITLFMRLTPHDQRTRSFRDVEQVLRERLDLIAGVTTASTNLPVGILLSGPNDAVLNTLGQAVRERIAGVAGLTAVTFNDVEARQAIVMDIHRDRLADVGASLEQVATAIGAFVSGTPIGIWVTPNGRQHDITLRFPPRLSGDVAQLSEVELVTGTGLARTITPLRAVADISVGDRARIIERVDGIRMVRVQASVSGRPLGDVAGDVKRALADLPVPKGYGVAYGGKIRELEESESDFAAALALAALLVFTVLMIFFGGVLTPLVIMASIPLGAVGALGWIACTGGTLNAFSGVGLLLVSGIVAKNGILLVDCARHAEEGGAARDQAVKTALAQRIRPILMTSAAMLLGMLPIAFGLGHGGEQLSAMGQAVVAGIVVSTGLSLIVVPALYALLPRRPATQQTSPIQQAPLMGG